MYRPLFSITLQALPIMYMYAEDSTKAGDDKVNGEGGAGDEDGMIKADIASAIANPFNHITKGSRNASGKLQVGVGLLLVCL